MYHGVGFDGDQKAEQLVEENHGPQEFLVSTKFGGDGASDLADETTD